MTPQSNKFVEPDPKPIFFNERRADHRPVRSTVEEKTEASILACVDDTSANALVISHAIAIGRGLDLPLILARVVETPSQFGHPVDPVDWQHRCNEHRHQLSQIAAFPLRDETPIESILLTGAVADSLSDWAIEHRVPLLALATHGHSASRRNGLGATAQRILECAATSLLLVPPSAMPSEENINYRRILVPLDGSCRAESVLPLASRIARAHGPQVTLQHAEIRGHGLGEEKIQKPPASAPGALTVAWGGGFAELDSSGDEGGDTTYTYRGGIYMASSVADSTRVWNVKVDKPQEVVGTLGDLEHLRGRLGPARGGEPLGGAASPRRPLVDRPSAIAAQYQHQQS